MNTKLGTSGATVHNGAVCVQGVFSFSSVNNTMLQFGVYYLSLVSIGKKNSVVSHLEPGGKAGYNC